MTYVETDSFETDMEFGLEAFGYEEEILIEEIVLRAPREKRKRVSSMKALRARRAVEDLLEQKRLRHNLDYLTDDGYDI